MTQREPIGERVAETIAVKAYDHYGDAIPIDIDPMQVADVAYDAIQKRKREKKAQQRPSNHFFLKVALGAGAIVCGTVVIAAVAISEVRKHV